MDLGLEKRVALVTGAGRGIGKAEARALAAEGARIAVNDLDEAAAEETAQELRELGVEALAVPGDVTDGDTIGRIVDEVVGAFGQIDVLVNNAGVGGRYLGRPATEITLEDWDFVVRSHLYSTFLCSRAVAPVMKANGFGRIINTSSMNYTGGGRPGVSSYSAAKAGVAGFTRTTAKELGPFGITVNAVAPGYVATELISTFTPAMMETITRQNPIGRCCTVEELGALVAFLSSTSAGFINGAIVCIDGGKRDFAWD